MIHRRMPTLGARAWVKVVEVGAGVALAVGPRVKGVEVRAVVATVVAEMVKVDCTRCG